MADEKPKSNPADALIISALIIVVFFGGSLVVFRERLSDGIGSLGGRYTLTENTPIGSTVRLSNDAPVFNIPDGEIVGVQSEESRGSIEGGPSKIDNQIWWDVDFETPPDGWVSSNSLVLVTGVSSFVRIIKIIAGILSYLFIFLGTYALLRINQVRKQEQADSEKLPEGAFAAGDISNERWEHVRTLAASDNPSDWRAAIIEADIMLDDLITSMGYSGETLGEKMKGIEESDFTTLNKAWEAHKARNQIAHQGSDFILTQREARRIIGLFEEVFEEFHYI